MRYFFSVLSIALICCWSLVSAQQFPSSPGSPIPYEYLLNLDGTTFPALVRDSLHPIPRRDSSVEQRSSNAPAAELNSSVLTSVGTLNWQGPMDMCVLNGFLYVASNLGVLAWDVRDPSNPTFVRQYDWPTTIGSTFVIKGKGDFLYLLSTYEGISIIEASHPDDLRIRSKIPLPVQEELMEIGGHYLYIPSQYDYFFVIDIADPDHPSIVTQFRSFDISFDGLRGIAMRETDSMPLVYFSSAIANSPLYIYTMDDSINPRHVRTYWGPADGKPAFYGRLIAVGDQLLGYMPGGTSFQIMQVGEPYYPQFGCGPDLGVTINDIEIVDTIMYVTTGTGVRTYNVASLCSPAMIGFALLDGFTDGTSGQCIVAGHYLYNYGSDGTSHVRIASSDLANPSNPITKTLYSSKFARKLYLSQDGPVLTASNWERQVSERIFDITNPFSPIPGADFGPGNNAEHTNGACFEGNFMYCSSDDASNPPRRGSISRFDVSEPTAPVKLSQLVLGTNADASHMSFQDAAVLNNYAYVAAEDSGLYVYQYLSLQYNPILRSRLSLPPGASAIRIRGNRAYVVCRGASVQSGLFGGAYMAIVDISNPLQLSIVGYQEPWGQYNIELVGDVVATTSWMIDHWAISLYQVDSTGWPEFVGSYDPPDRSGNLILLELTAQHMYVDNGDFLDIVDISDPTNPQLAERQYRVEHVYDVAVKGEAVYLGQRFGIQVYRGPSCCEGTSGNVDGNAGIDLSDLSWLIAYMVSSGGLNCIGEADIDQSGNVDLSDLSALVYYLVSGEYQLPACQ